MLNRRDVVKKIQSALTAHLFISGGWAVHPMIYMPQETIQKIFICGAQWAGPL